MRTDLDEMEKLDRMATRAEPSMTAGMDSLHAVDPLTALLLAEEETVERKERERHALQCEIFNGMLEYLLAAGPEPAMVRERLEGALQSFAPQVVPRMQGPERWAPPVEVEQVLRRHAEALREIREAARGRGSLARWSREMDMEEDRETVVATLTGLIRYWLSEGMRWRNAVAVTLCLAKALRPALIGGMSLEDVARLCGDHGGRATPSARIRRLYNARVSAAGMLASQVHFQKSAAACERYAKAQKGNSNRKKRRRRVA